MSNNVQGSKPDYKVVNRLPSNRAISGDSVVSDEIPPSSDANAVIVKTIPNETDKDAWKRYIPVLYWAPKYSFKNFFVSDLIAGITGLIMIIPQAMGYALTAGIDARYGLYAALFGPLLYWPFGTSGQVSIILICL